tara:strand:- start:17249 stop:17746 length:498 start_codon:yes stop_codon:yes gene_type:complete
MSDKGLNKSEELKSRLEALEKKLGGSNKSSNESANNINISFSINDSLEKLSYWTNFIGTILYIVFALSCCGIMYLILQAGMEDIPAGILFGWLIGLTILFFSAKYLCDFSSNTLKCLRGSGSQYKQNNLEDGLANLAAFFRLHGIIIIINLCILVISVMYFISQS